MQWAAQVPYKHAAAAGQGSFSCLAEVESQKGKTGAENTLITTKNSHILKSTKGDKLQIDSSLCNLCFNAPCWAFRKSVVLKGL